MLQSVNSRPLRNWRRGLRNVVQLSFECHAVQSLEGKTKEQADPPVQQEKSISEGAFDLCLTAANRRRIGYAPMGA